MARMARVVVPFYPHHVTQRGNRRQRTFFDDNDYRTYLELKSEFCQEVETRVWAYCLMPNHVHLVMVPSHVDGLRAATTTRGGRLLLLCALLICCVPRASDRDRWAHCPFLR